MAHHRKTAAPDVAQAQLEQTFSDLANARLRDAAPALVDHLVGFQLVKTDDDGSRAVGMFGCEVGEKYFYIPTFFLAGEIKGTDSIYSPDSDLFCPLTEEWVNQILNQRPSQLGKPNKDTDSERGTRNPNYYRLRQIPSGAGTNLGGQSGLLNKNGSAGIVGGAGLTQSAALTMFALMEKCATSQERTSEDSLDLPEALSHFPKLAAGFLADLKSNEKLAHYAQEFYSLLDFSVPEMVKRADSDGDDIIIVSEVGQPGASELSDEQKEKVITGGTAVVDRRPEFKKSKVYRTEVKQQLTSATAGGLYDVLMADGTLSECLVLKIASSDDMMVYELDSGKACIIASQHVITLKQYEPAEFRAKLEAEAIDADKVKNGDAATFVSQSGECSIPFVIDSIVSNDGIKVLKTDGQYYLPMSSGMSVGAGAWNPGGYVDRANAAPAVWRYQDVADRIKDIIVSEAGGGQIRYFNDRMAINTRKFKALILNTKGKADECGYRNWSRDSDEAALRTADFGTADTVLKQMEKISHPLKIWTENDYLVIRDCNGSVETLGKVAALGHLMRKHGCTADDAEIMIKEASRAPQTFRVKYAAHLLDVADPQDESESGPMSSYHPTQFDTHVVDKATSDDNRPFYEYNSPFAGNDDQQGEDSDASPKKTMDAVQKATETGQKEVFDAAVLGSLVKSHNPTDLVERFLPTIVAGMDRLGRILFLLHWHYDQFNERYGDKDLAEFGDNLKSTFESLGDLVLFMKRRTLAGDPDYYGLGLSATVDG
jgi:hypothetical protein